MFKRRLVKVLVNVHSLHCRNDIVIQWRKYRPVNEYNLTPHSTHDKSFRWRVLQAHQLDWRWQVLTTLPSCRDESIIAGLLCGPTEARQVSLVTIATAESRRLLQLQQLLFASGWRADMREKHSTLLHAKSTTHYYLSHTITQFILETLFTRRFVCHANSTITRSNVLQHARRAITAGSSADFRAR